MSAAAAIRLSGQVERGLQRGRQLGFPTANLDTQAEGAAVAAGVWAAWARWPGTDWQEAVVNVGVRPTFGAAAPSVEVHVLDFDGDLYGRQLDVMLVSRLRDERRFADTRALTAQIRADIENTRQALAGRESAQTEEWSSGIDC